MLPRNSKLAGQIIKSLRTIPKSQRSVAIEAMEDHYKNLKDGATTIHPNTKALKRSLKKMSHEKVSIYDFDPEIMNLLNEEAQRQKKSIDLIASSNIPVPEMNEITGHLSNKSSPGYPGSRFFNGDNVMDKLERLCYDRALKAFNLYPEDWSVNVQSLSGSIGNLCTFYGLLKPGDTILSLETKTGGGHHTHGLKDDMNQGTNIYSQVWNIDHYHVDEDYNIDYEDAQK